MASSTVLELAKEMKVTAEELLRQLKTFCVRIVRLKPAKSL